MEKNLFVSLIGEPNVGKSTLLNAMIGCKVAIVTPKAQTTRMPQNGIVTKGEIQYVITDTPGLLDPRNRLDARMSRSIIESCSDSDLVMLVVYPKEKLSDAELKILSKLRDSTVPVFLCVNKSDIIKQPSKKGSYYTDVLGKQFKFDGSCLVSAKTGDGLDRLFQEIDRFAVPGEHQFSDDDMTDSSVRSMCAEIMREKLFLNLREEIPYGCAVMTESFREREDGITEIEFVILCDKENHRGIIIGKHGSMLKKISTEARADIEELLGTKVFMKSFVKVRRDWRNSESVMHELSEM
ncbi:MAG: GTPase Era [Oscillospiraceae bacterium]|jgi:GTP-binding protein Era